MTMITKKMIWQLPSKPPGSIRKRQPMMLVYWPIGSLFWKWKRKRLGRKSRKPREKLSRSCKLGKGMTKTVFVKNSSRSREKMKKPLDMLKTRQQELLTTRPSTNRLNLNTLRPQMRQIVLRKSRKETPWWLDVKRKPRWQRTTVSRRWLESRSLMPKRENKW